MCQRKTICDECKKDTDGLMTCTYPDGEEIYLCPTCLKADGSFCLSCGEFCSGIESFDFAHPGYCDNCRDEILLDDWDDEDENDYGSDYENGEYDRWGDDPFEENECNYP